MNRFNYKAKDKNGRLVVGEVEASDINFAAKLNPIRFYKEL